MPGKSHDMEDILKIIERQQIEIDNLKQQSRHSNGDTNDNDVVSNGNVNGNSLKGLQDRIQDIEDVVTDMKGDLTELMLVYQDIQDKLFDIDR